MMADSDAPDQQRTLHFPEGYRGGWLVVLAGDGNHQHVYSRPRVAPEVVVPGDAEVCFSFRPFSGPVDWSGLSLLRPDDLTQLDASRVPIQLSDLTYLERLSGLHSLMLTNTALTDDGLRAVEPLRDLEFLNLGGTRITSQGLVSLRHLAKLQQVYLYGTQIDDAGLAHLRYLPTLQRVSLFATAVSDRGLAHLAGIHTLQRLSLQETAVTPEGVARFKESLPDCKIELHWEEDGPDGFTEQDLAIFPYAERASAVEFARLANNEAAHRRDGNKPETIEAWEKTVAQVRAALERAYPPGFWELTSLLQYGNPHGLEQAIRFLEADPWFFSIGLREGKAPPLRATRTVVTRACHAIPDHCSLGDPVTGSSRIPAVWRTVQGNRNARIPRASQVVARP